MTHPCEHLFDPTSFIRTCQSADCWQAACLRSWDPARCPGTRNEQDTRWCPTQHSLPALQISHHLSMPSLLAGDLRSEQLRCFLQDKARDPEENVALKPHHMLWWRAWRWWKSHSPRNKWANLVCEFNPNIYMSYWIIIPNHQVNSNHHPKPPGDFFLHLKNHQTCSMVRICTASAPSSATTRPEKASSHASIARPRAPRNSCSQAASIAFSRSWGRKRSHELNHTKNVNIQTTLT